MMHTFHYEISLEQLISVAAGRSHIGWHCLMQVSDSDKRLCRVEGCKKEPPACAPVSSVVRCAAAL